MIVIERLINLEATVSSVERETKAQNKIMVEVCRDIKAHRKEFAKHTLDDNTRFTKLERDSGWLKKIGMFLIAALGAAKYFKI